MKPWTIKIKIYREKNEYNPKEENSSRNSDGGYGMYCTSSEIPVCTGHEKGIRKVKNESLLKLMPEDTELHKTLTVTCVLNCRHISFVTSDQFWISDRKCNLSLTNRKVIFFVN